MSETAADAPTPTAAVHHTPVREPCDVVPSYPAPDMSERRRKLDQATAGDQPEAVRIPLDLVDPSPHNPRRGLDELDQLADNIKTFGLLQPVTVRPKGGRFELIGGHRRLAAYKVLREREPHEPKWRAIRAEIRTVGDEQALLMLLASQIQIADWHPKEQAHALEQFALSGMTNAEIARRINRSESYVSKRLRVFADSVLSGYVQTGALTPAKAEELLLVLDVETRKQLAARVIAEDWSQDRIRGETRALRLDKQLAHLSRVARELLNLLSAINGHNLPIETRRDLWTIHGKVETLANASNRKTRPKLVTQPLD